MCSPGLRAGKWLLSKRLPLQWHDPPPTPLAKGPRLRFYLGCQPHSSHFTVQTSTGTHTLTQGCNYCQGSQCRENGLQPTCYKVFPAGSLSMWIHFIPAILRTTGIRLIGDLFRDWIVVTEKPVMTLTSSFICLIYVSAIIRKLFCNRDIMSHLQLLHQSALCFFSEHIRRKTCQNTEF